MSGYKLADGSLSSIYKVGDEFEVVGRNIGSKVSIGDVVKFYRDDKTDSPWLHDGSWCCAWDSLKPTPETKRKVHYRETGKWLVLEGDYVVHADMSFEQYMKWCEAAEESGFSLDYIKLNVCAITFADDEGDLVSSWYTDIGAKTNTTEEFLEFLAKEEKDMKQFTKGDLKDGMVVSLRDDRQGIVFDGRIERTFNDIRKTRMSNPLADTIYYRDDLKDDDGVERFDIMKVVDRDGTVLFEREEEPTEPTELTLEEIAEKFGLPVERVRIKK